jgi:AmmeMemoRadiSam system protein A
MPPPIHPIVRLAKETVDKFTSEKKIPKKVELPEDLPEEFTTGKAGVFVSLKIGGQLRGCIGTFMPVTGSIAEEAIRNSIAAASEDPRFPPVDKSELDVIDYSVDVLSTPEPVESVSALDPRRYGVIIKSGGRRGLLLPDLEGVDTVEDQLRITRMKAGIEPDEEISIERFEVKRYK